MLRLQGRAGRVLPVMRHFMSFMRFMVNRVLVAARRVGPARPIAGWQAQQPALKGQPQGSGIR
jgi:hypothetical protein